MMPFINEIIKKKINKNKSKEKLYKTNEKFKRKEKECVSAFLGLLSFQFRFVECPIFSNQNLSRLYTSNEWRLCVFVY
jgi:hypothetical protein